MEENNKPKRPTGPRPAPPKFGTANDEILNATNAVAVCVESMLGDKLNISGAELRQRIYKLMTSDGLSNAYKNQETMIRLLECKDVADEDRMTFLKDINSINKDVQKEIALELSFDAALDAAEYAGGKLGEFCAKALMKLFTSSTE